MDVISCKYLRLPFYLIILDDYTQFVWIFSLKRKSDVHPILRDFFTYVRTQFQLPVFSLQTDNGREFDNTYSREFFARHGAAIRLSCPYNSQQNGKAECILRTLNDSVRTLLLHASMPPRFWAEALNTTTFLLNRWPCHTSMPHTPHELLLGVAPDYNQPCVFGCLCYPNTSSTARNKLDYRSTACWDTL